MENGLQPSPDPHPLQPLFWARGPCQGSVASADLVTLGWGGRVVARTPTARPGHLPCAKLVGIMGCRQGRRWGGVSQRLDGGL